MNVLSRWLRRIVIWTGPVLVLFLAVVCGFLYWAARSAPGARWVVTTAVEALGGRVDGVTGSLWRGVSLESLTLAGAGFSLRVAGAHLRVDWRDLARRRLHVRDLSAGSISLDLQAAAHPRDEKKPFAMPAIPIDVVVDRLAVGHFTMNENGKPVPVTAGALDAALSLTDGKARLALRSLAVIGADFTARAHGGVTVSNLRRPWPLDGELGLSLAGRGADSPLCARRYVPSLPPADTASANEAPKDCSARIDATARGTVDRLDVALTGRGQGLSLNAQARLAPTAAFPVHGAAVELRLADGSALEGRLDWTAATPAGGVERDRVTGSLRTRALNLGVLAGRAIPPAVVTMTADFDARLLDRRFPQSVAARVVFARGSSWNRQPLTGQVAVDAVARPPAKVPRAPRARDDATVAPDGASRPGAAGATRADPADFPSWTDLTLRALDVDLRLGAGRIDAKGAFGTAKSRLDFDMRAPALATFWPGLPGGLQVMGSVTGTVADHQASVAATYLPDTASPAGRARRSADPAEKRAARSGEAFAANLSPVRVTLRLNGRWGPMGGSPAGDGWRGSISRFEASSGDLGLALRAPVQVSYAPRAVGNVPEWQVGTLDVQALMPAQNTFVIHNALARGGSGWWEVRGGVPRLAVSRRLINTLRRRFGSGSSSRNGGVRVSDDRAPSRELVLAADWNLRFRGALEGQARIRRVAGDLSMPGDPKDALGLQSLDLAVVARRRGGAVSELAATLNMTAAKVGRLSARGSAAVHTAGAAAWTLDAAAPGTIAVDANVADLGVFDALVDDQTELGGSLTVDADATIGAGGAWHTRGVLRGKGIKFVRVDDGVRLFNGTLEAHLDGTRLVLDSLRFPALLRVAPKEWRTQEWVANNPGAKGGSLALSGDWDLLAANGTVTAKLTRYPILQRSDRYAMLSGVVTLVARPPSIAITGDVAADAGWFDLDVLGSVPAVDGDVVVIRPGRQRTVQVPADLSLDLKVDLGPRFYLTGYGVNSGLVGSLRVVMKDNKLTGVGELRTRGGSIDVYGQHLQLRRGTVTFQGNIANPVLDIEALRTGLAVQAGVRVSGTAKKPKIDLMSIPDVSEAEKLSWLLLGRAPDAGGGDVALLFSVGSSLLGGGEPFYRKLGLDELSIRTGELGTTGSVLPPQSVVSSANQNPSPFEQQFAQAGKHLSDGVTLSLEQALATTGTVGRLSYRLSRRWRAELSVGTANGIALIYHVFFGD